MDEKKGLVRIAFQVEELAKLVNTLIDRVRKQGDAILALYEEIERMRGKI